MIIADNFQERFKSIMLAQKHEKLSTREMLLRDLFILSSQEILQAADSIVLISAQGLILSCVSPHFTNDLQGSIVDTAALKIFSKRCSSAVRQTSDGCTIICCAGKHSEEFADKVNNKLMSLISVFDTRKDREGYVLSCFDILDDAICIFDKTATLVYANKKYLSIMHIENLQSAIGMHIQDIINTTGIKIQSTKNGSRRLKMLDVLKSGQKTLNWEVMVESENVSNKAEIVSNNMYPIMDGHGNVEGLIEISSSHQVNLNKMKKIMGLTAEYTFDSIIGESSSIKNTIQQAKEYADSPYNLLIVGESGSGKELFAHSIHNYSSRRFEPFVALNCANFPENLIESELFGYVGGAFTGASKNGQIGKFELADGGTLFLDEIAELPLHFQPKLLRVLETQRISRIGSSSDTPVNVRVLAATNRDIEEMVDEGLFRKDLYYRLQVLTIEVPPLRDRDQDPLLLGKAFLDQALRVNGLEKKRFAKETEDLLLRYVWPGNVRELRNVIQRVTLLSKSDVVTADDLRSAIQSKRHGILKSYDTVSSLDSIDDCLAAVKNAYVQLLNTSISKAGGNKKRAAELIGVSRRTLYRMLEKYNVRT